ncbi:hypothetical protein BRADO4332 [Bradyrhizobium sp. ORS 278]|uniref:hypothetical protein n=1 Tax=Bradyrhizobium sp. (strain ORS 278) TaxID=114615 RepID=UPI0001507F44|nr:hypothetical protein [Bradyrhizobium sp. ORS 278]CAL78080.1 hypothetical protein BRADO4332 [Bradyrhizobium sp. ORS 278]
MPSPPVFSNDMRARRLDGRDPRGAVYFLPWGMGFAAARWLGLVHGHDWQACYRLPDAMVGPDPDTCADCIAAIERDVTTLAARNGPPSRLIGFSLGSVPATLMAGRLGRPVWSFASADRGELMIWSSPAARAIRREAERRGFERDDFAAALSRYNPIHWVDRVALDSRFVVGRFDRLVPRARGQALLARARGRIAGDHLVELPLGHVAVLAASGFLQRRWLRAERMR